MRKSKEYIKILVFYDELGFVRGLDEDRSFAYSIIKYSTIKQREKQIKEILKKLNENGEHYELKKIESIIPYWAIRNLHNHGNCLLLNSKAQMYQTNMNYGLTTILDITLEIVKNELEELGFKEIKFKQSVLENDYIVYAV